MMGVTQLFFVVGVEHIVLNDLIQNYVNIAVVSLIKVAVLPLVALIGVYIRAAFPLTNAA